MYFVQLRISQNPKTPSNLNSEIKHAAFFFFHVLGQQRKHRLELGPGGKGRKFGPKDLGISSGQVGETSEEPSPC